MKTLSRLPIVLLIAGVFLSVGAYADAVAAKAGTALADPAADAGYQLPPQAIVDLIDAPSTPSVRLGPDPKVAALLYRPSLTSLAELAETEVRLAGLRIKPDINGPSRMVPTADIKRLDLETGEVKEIQGLPEDLRLVYWSWSPDGRHGVFGHVVESGIELWKLSFEALKAERLLGPRLNMTSRTPPRWIDNGHVIVLAVPEQRGAAPTRSRLPQGPTVQENLGGKAPARTFQDLLKDRHDEALFDHYLTSEPLVIALDGTAKSFGAPAVYWNLDPSPDGSYVMVQTLHRPYSYLVQASRFPMKTEIWDREGKVVHMAYDRPLQEAIPIAFGSVAEGPRNFSWRGDAPATLVWAEARDGGDAAKEAEIRDEVFLLPAPFEAEPESMIRLAYRYGGISWGNDDLALVDSWWWQTRHAKSWRVRPGDLSKAPELLYDRSWEDRYNDPGSPVREMNAFGRLGVKVSKDGRYMFRTGSGASPEGDRPFLDRVDLKTGETERLFRSEAPYYESPIRVVDDRGDVILTRREAVEEVPDYYVRDLKKDTLEPLTRFPHPTPELKGIQKELIHYERADGVPLTATLLLPAGYDAEKDGPLPMLMWAYPLEYKSADAAGQVQGSPYRFNRMGWWSQMIWLTQGYAVLDDPQMPIIGEGETEPNDTFREQLVASAEAAVNEVIRRGVAKAGHIAVGGHSYGAFMTAHLLAHSDLFAAGIARSGAYNRTLTPFGFQSEQRTLWEAPEIYAQISPFMHAHKVNEPILLIHGQADNNSGTFPMQSERFYNALKGHGATTRLVVLPLESHGYRARESILHVMWETHRWLETYVSFDAAKAEVSPASTSSEAAAGGG